MSRVVQLNSTPKGIAFARLAIAAALGKSGDYEAVSRIRFGEDALPTRIAKAGGLENMAIAKAEVAAGATVSGNWAAVLVDAEGAAAEFFSLVRERSLIGRIPGFRRVPLQVKLIGLATGFAAAWVGEGKAVPMSKASFAADTLPSRRVSALTVVTDELLESADPAAEAMIRDDLVKAVTAVIDATFIGDAAAVSGVRPAGIGYNAPSANATGDGLADLRLLIDTFPGDLETAVLIGSPESFAAMHDPVYLPGLGVRGGEALGIPAIASTAAGSTITLLDPAGIAVGQGATDVRTSREASIEMLDSNLDGDSIAVVPGAAASLVSLWQTNSAGILVDQSINWKQGRPSVAVLEGVDQS